jgi:hypothetical protein
MKKVMLTVLFMSIAILAIGCSSQDTPKDVAELYLKATKKQDIEAMVNLLDPEHITFISEYLGTTKEEMILTAEKNRGDNKLTKYKIGKVKDSEENKERKIVEVDVTVVINGQKLDRKAEIQVLERDGQWWVINENIFLEQE